MTKQIKSEIIEHPAQTAGILGVIERIAGNPEIDVERMQVLLKMRAEEEERIRRMAKEDRDDEARRSWLRNFAKVQGAVGTIRRGRSNTHTKSQYADLADIEQAVTPVLTEHGFSTSAAPIPCELDGHIRIRLTIGHEEGHEKTYEDVFPLDAAGSAGKVNKTPIQAKGSTQTYGRRYLKASALDLAFGDDDDGNAQVATISAEQFIALRDLASDAGVDPDKLCLAYKAPSLEQFPVASFESAMKKLRITVEEKAK